MATTGSQALAVYFNAFPAEMLRAFAKGQDDRMRPFGVLSSPSLQSKQLFAQLGKAGRCNIKG